MNIRKAKLKDVEKLILIGKKVSEFRVDSNVSGFWSQIQLNKWIKSKSDVILIAEELNEIMGFVMFAHHIPTGKATFENGWLHKNYRGKDIISELTKEGLKQLKSKGAKYVCGLVKVKNDNSIKFLEKNKFKKGFDFTWMHRSI